MLKLVIVDGAQVQVTLSGGVFVLPAGTFVQ